MPRHSYNTRPRDQPPHPSGHEKSGRDIPISKIVQAFLIGAPTWWARGAIPDPGVQVGSEHYYGNS